MGIPPSKSNLPAALDSLINEKEFDMIASPNEAKMTFGKYASSKQKSDAFGGKENDYDNGFYKTHKIKATSIKVTQVLDKSKFSA